MTLKHTNNKIHSASVKMAGQPPRTRVLVIGCGLGGTSLVQTLGQVTTVRFDITVVDKRDFFENIIATPSVMLDPRLLAKAAVPHSSYLPCFIHGVVVALDTKAGSCTVRGTLDALEQHVAFDVVVVCTGATWGNLQGTQGEHEVVRGCAARTGS